MQTISKTKLEISDAKPPPFSFVIVNRFWILKHSPHRFTFPKIKIIRSSEIKHYLVINKPSFRKKQIIKPPKSLLPMAFGPFEHISKDEDVGSD